MSLEELLRTFQVFDTQCHEFLSSFRTPDSKFSTINDPPSAVEIPQIQDIVSQHETQLTAIDDILERIKVIADRLNDKRKQIVSSTKMHKSFLSCIRRLPSEILGKIFSQCLPNETYLTPSRRRAPWLFTGICRRWREVALNTPRLWSSLLITPTGEKRLGLYRDWLEKSKHAPLSLSISLAPETDGELWPSMALDFAQPYTSRCIEFKVEFDTEDSLHVLLKDVPILESLWIIGKFDKKGPKQNISTVQPQSRLRTLIIHSQSSPSDLSPSNLSVCDFGWTSLTTLSLVFDNQSSYPIRSHLFLELLEMCPNLETLMCRPFLLCAPGSPLSFGHQKLRVLHLARIKEAAAMFPLDTLNLPSLVHLSIDDSSSRFHHTPIPQLSPLPESGRSLNITMRHKFQDTLFMTLQPGWNEITHLRIEVTRTIHETAFFLPLRYCPHLEHLILFFDTDDMEQKGDNFITCAALRSLTVNIPRYFVFRILGNLTVPSLRHLHLQVEDGKHYKEYLVATLDKFFARSKPPLETLKIRGIPLGSYAETKVASFAPTAIVDISV